MTDNETFTGRLLILLSDNFGIEKTLEALFQVTVSIFPEVHGEKKH